ncbi:MULTISPECIES: hypothetical protein [Paenibacillus]|nr:hypothetical protein [Paenibacillus camelliae]MCM3633531.1 hypothetical protein [Paenibacillus camelliae]
MIVIIIILILIFFAVLDISVTGHKQLKQSEDIEHAIYRLIEITKQKDKE